MSDERWTLAHEDCIEHMARMPDGFVDFAVFSPPFPSLFAYTDQASDIGNSEDFRGDAKLHLSFFFRQLARVVKPGRVLNLQVATRQVFSGLQDSYESFYQCVKRSNRIGSTLPLNVHIPATDIEMPMIENVLRKASRVDSDTREQEQIFMEMAK